jgi:hypothetical protein
MTDRDGPPPFRVPPFAPRPPLATGYGPSFFHARSFALRARGLRAISAWVGVIGRRVIVVPSARPRQVHRG